MSPWRDQLLPASFRGVPFQVRSDSLNGGRRASVHQGPRRDGASVDDLGRAPRRISVDAHLLGADFRERAEALQEALEAFGPGVLVLPTRAPIQAQVLGFRDNRENVGRTGRAVLSLEFIEVDQAAGVQPIADPRRLAAAAADAHADLAEAGFLQRIIENNVPEFVREALRDGLEQAAEVFNQIPITGALTDPVEWAQLKANLTNGALSGALGGAEGAELAKALTRRVYAASGAGRAGLAQLERLFGLERPAPKAKSALGKAAEENQGAVIDLVGQFAAAELVRAAAQTAWESRQQAEQWRARIDARLREVEASGVPDVVASLQALRVQLAGAVPPPDAQLPETVTFTPGAPVFAELVAYQAYGNADRASEITRRNDVPNPLSIPAGQPLELLITT